MRARIRSVWRRKRWLALGAGLAALVTLVFLVRAVVHLAAWDHGPQIALRPWMTLAYVARVSGVERDVLAMAVGIDPTAPIRVTIAQVAARTGRPLDAVEADLRAAIAADRAEDAR